MRSSFCSRPRSRLRISPVAVPGLATSGRKSSTPPSAFSDSRTLLLFGPTWSARDPASVGL